MKLKNYYNIGQNDIMKSELHPVKLTVQKIKIRKLRSALDILSEPGLFDMLPLW